MAKPTLDDFYREPRKAYANGFRLTWKLSVIYVIKYTFIKSWLEIFDLLLEIVRDYIWPTLLNLLIILSILLVIITMPIFFPLWVIFHHLDLKKRIKYHFGEDEND